MPGFVASNFPSPWFRGSEASVWACWPAEQVPGSLHTPSMAPQSPHISQSWPQCKMRAPLRPVSGLVRSWDGFVGLCFGGHTWYRDLLQRLRLGPRRTGEPTRQGRAGTELNEAFLLPQATSSVGFTHIFPSPPKSGKSHQLALEGDRS